ncbi:hypothetical protein EN837_24735 [bacterium M00.F.Ca.ET.194.01.1.1]|nr:hypothetical protein EN837_24735 [bacterium M00.F.Ca.ET.194.01.1.1]TGS52403.1 hypothetical protein EN822_24400 [bacterium M00.F.Ca.ET.179.01.1.1]TGV44264.1 hypothetical protein EN811_24400 [bacterium M00.F.Ca.ET.168.01.1.1]
MFIFEKLFYRVRVALWRVSFFRRNASPWPFKVEVCRHIDASEPDEGGFYSYHYEYDVYVFSDGVMMLTARAYIDEPTKAELIGWARGERSCRLKRSDLDHPLVLRAAEHLRQAGKSDLSWLSAKDRGYVRVNVAAA